MDSRFKDQLRSKRGIRCDTNDGGEERDPRLPTSLEVAKEVTEKVGEWTLVPSNIRVGSDVAVPSGPD